ncbi:MAG: Holliday junction branch migration protein RuvA [bacterium]|nr:Holliday junction branch migration protein RuvA [bacterium]
MIASLKGIVTGKSANGLIVEVNGIGYEIFVTDQLLVNSQVGQKTALLIAEYIREDHYSLFGFSDEQQKNFYGQLVAISGVGPKMAMTILSTDSVENLQKAALSGKVEVFKNILGVGAKTAQRIIIELKGKIDLSAKADNSKDPAYQALITLGYNNMQANEAVKNLPDDINVNEKVKLALKQLSK